MEQRIAFIMDKIRTYSQTKSGCFALGVMATVLPCYFVWSGQRESLDRERVLNDNLELEKKELLKEANNAYNEGMRKGTDQLMYHYRILDSIENKFDQKREKIQKDTYFYKKQLNENNIDD